MPRKFTCLLLACAVVVSGFAAITPGLTQQALAAGGTKYYVDCVAGNDGASGTSSSNAWKSLDPVNSATLSAGDQLLLKRGCSWDGPLKASWHGTSANPIMISAYGSGDRPMIKNAPNANVKISGSYIIVQYLQTRHDMTAYELDGSCLNQPVGWKIGFQFDGAAHHNTVRHSKTSNHSMGFGMSDNSHHNVIFRNEIRDNVGLWRNEPGDPLGGLGVNLHGNANEVAWNTFANNNSLCTKAPDGGIGQYTSSISIELFNATNSNVHHNVSYDRIFVEMGSSSSITSADNTFAYNVHSNNEERSRFVVTRGAGEPHGPVWRTSLYNNVVYNIGNDGQGVVCMSCSNQVLEMKNNIIVASDKAIYVNSGNTINETHNLYWHPGGLPLPNNFIQNWEISPTSIIADPHFVNPAGKDFHVSGNSPVIDRGTNEPAGEGYTEDLDGDAAPGAAAMEIGVDERDGPGATINEPPTVSAPTYAPPVFRLTPSAVPVPVAWSGSDSDGVSLHELQLSTDGGAFVTVKTIASGAENQSTALNLPPWHDYQLRVRATDNLGAVSDWSTGETFSIRLYEESSSSIPYSGSWTTASMSGAYGGALKHASAKGSNVTFTFTGTSVSWISVRGNNRGKAEVWLDGVKMQTVDLYVNGGAMSRRVAFTADGLDPNFTHTLEIKVLGAKNQNSSSKRVDLDAIVVFD